MRTEANLPSFLLAYLHVGFLRAHLNPYHTLLVLALWTVAVTAAVVLLSSLGHPSSKIGDYIDPLICFAGLGRGLNPALNLLSVIFSHREHRDLYP